MKPWIILAPLALAACATGAPQGSATNGRAQCDAAAIDDLVGKTADSALGIDALKRSRTRILRWLRPDSIMTMDYRIDRLNVKIDADNRVTGFTCG